MATQADARLPLNENYTATPDGERKDIYKGELFKHASGIVADLCMRQHHQWSLLSHTDPGVVLFEFSNHQRITFSRRGDRLFYRFRTNRFPRRISGYSFRCLWIAQSPVFRQEVESMLPPIDIGTVYLTFNENTGHFRVRLCWTKDLFIPSGEVLIEVLVERGGPVVTTTSGEDAVTTPEPQPVVVV